MSLESSLSSTIVNIIPDSWRLAEDHAHPHQLLTKYVPYQTHLVAMASGEIKYRISWFPIPSETDDKPGEIKYTMEDQTRPCALVIPSLMGLPPVNPDNKANFKLALRRNIDEFLLQNPEYAPQSNHPDQSNIIFSYENLPTM